MALGGSLESRLVAECPADSPPQRHLAPAGLASYRTLARLRPGFEAEYILEHSCDRCEVTLHNEAGTWQGAHRRTGVSDGGRRPPSALPQRAERASHRTAPGRQ